MSNPVVLFDGVCNLCNNAVQFIVKHDPKGIYKLAALQSDVGKQLLSKYSLMLNQPDSIVLIENGKVYLRSTAALRISRNLSGAVKLLYGFIIVPAIIRDVVYKFIAENRFKWFGKKNECMVPGPAIENRFLK